jgi:hypothetical protein
MTDRLFYKKVLAIEVLSEEPIPEGMEVDSIIEQAITGDYSMRVLPSTDTVLNGKEAADALLEQASDPGFFGLTHEGNDNE